jgi:hypothetical protein
MPLLSNLIETIASIVRQFVIVRLFHRRLTADQQQGRILLLYDGPRRSQSNMMLPARDDLIAS